MIALTVLILSLLWIGFDFGIIPGPGDAMSHSGQWIALGIDVVTFVLGIIAVALASRRRFSWPMAIVFVTSPLIHFIGNFVGEIRILFFEFSCAAVIVVVMAHYVPRFAAHFGRSGRA
jgi:hypothetical protein